MRIYRVGALIAAFMACIGAGRAQAQQTQIYPLDMQYDILFQENSSRFDDYRGSQDDLRRTWRILRELNQSKGVRLILRTSRPPGDDTTQDRLRVIANQLGRRPDVIRHPRVRPNVLQPVAYFAGFPQPNCDEYVLQIKNWAPFGDRELRISPPQELSLSPGVQVRMVPRARMTSSEAFVTVPQATASLAPTPIAIRYDGGGPQLTLSRATGNHLMGPGVEPPPPCETDIHPALR